MKKCAKCGCYNQDERNMCADCGRTLFGAELVSKEELDVKLEKMSRYSDPFSFKLRHQVVFYASLLLIAVNILMINLSLTQPLLAFNAIICFIWCIPVTRFSETMWNIKKFFMQFTVSGDIEPSDLWFIGREIAIFGIFGIGIITFIYGLTYNN